LLGFLFGSPLPPLHCTSQVVAARRHHSDSNAAFGPLSSVIYRASMAPSQIFRAALSQANKGNTEAQVFVQTCYYDGGEGVNRDLTLSFNFCRMAAEGGHATSQLNVGTRYSRGIGVERDERKASTWYLRAAKEGGNSEAQFYTALRYRLGTGHDAPNMEESVKWYQAAVAQDHPDAELRLGDCYDEGNGVKKNPGLALKLWRKCAQHHEAGDHAPREGFLNFVAYAHHLIGECYLLGENGVEKDMAMAMQWWTKSAEQGYGYGCAGLWLRRAPSERST
jgi:TPR repeat protein